MKRLMALGAVLVALGAGGAALGQKAAAGGAAAAQNDGGLSVLPAVVEHGPQPGPLATLPSRTARRRRWRSRSRRGRGCRPPPARCP